MLSCSGINKSNRLREKIFYCLLFACKPHCTQHAFLRREPRAAPRVSSRTLWSICLRRPTFHNDSNLCGPVLALSAAGQNTRGIGAESIPLSGSRSHSTLSLPFRFMHWVMKVPSFPLLWITYWNPAVEEWFKNSLYISAPLPGGGEGGFYNLSDTQWMHASSFLRISAENTAGTRLSFQASFNVRILER